MNEKGKCVLKKTSLQDAVLRISLEVCESEKKERTTTKKRKQQQKTTTRTTKETATTTKGTATTTKGQWRQQSTKSGRKRAIKKAPSASSGVGPPSFCPHQTKPPKLNHSRHCNQISENKKALLSLFCRFFSWLLSLTTLTLFLFFFHPYFVSLNVEFLHDWAKLAKSNCFFLSSRLILRVFHSRILYSRPIHRGYSRGMFTGGVCGEVITRGMLAGA